MKFYITKYALTTGIYEAHGEITGSCNNLVSLERPSVKYVEKPYWYIGKEDAIAHAERMRIIKTKSLKKQLEKLERMKFE